MISIKYASIIAVAAFAAGSFFASPVPAAMAAVIATDVQCTGCVGTSDLAGNAVTAAKIKDSEVKAAEIATDAVGAAELQGVTKQIFAQCVLSATEKNTVVAAQAYLNKACNISGLDVDDTAVATLGIQGVQCFVLVSAIPNPNEVDLQIKNDCGGQTSIGALTDPIGIIVFDK